jgi:hypothetical protein
MLPPPLQFLAAWLAVWLGRVLQQEVDYLTAENRLLREKLGGRKLRLTDAERRRLAVLGKELGRRVLATAAFRGILKAAGVKAVRLPAMSPNLSAYAERFVLSIKSECLERIVPLGEGHLRHAISEYMAHYHRERNHQGLGNALIDGEQQDVAGAGRIVRRERLGGLLSFYHRKTAVRERTE